MKKNGLDVALHFLKFRPRSVFEVEQKLKSKRFADEEIKKIIRVLKKNKLLDDKEFAKMWVRDRNLLKPSGSYLLRLELRKFGIADDIIVKVLEGQDEEELARKALESKARYRKADFEKSAQGRSSFGRKAAFLQRRGFSTSVMYKVLKETF